jgi:hypothetical protein
MQHFVRFLLLVAVLAVAASPDAAVVASRPHRTFVTNGRPAAFLERKARYWVPVLVRWSSRAW